MGIVRQDTFVRSNVGSGFGTATDGNTWSLYSGISWGSSKVNANEGVITGTAGGSVFAYIGSALSGADCEALARFQINVAGDLFGINLRGLNTNVHTLWLARYNGGNINLMYGNGTSYVTVNTTAFSVTLNTRYWMKFRVQGTTISVKMWQYATAEPVAWTAQIADVDVPSAGVVGLYGNSVSGTGVQIDSFQVNDLGANSLQQTGRGNFLIRPALKSVLQAKFKTNDPAAGTKIGDIAATTPSISWSGVAGSPGTEDRYTYTDSSTSGWFVGAIPTYGGMPIASVGPVDYGVATQEHALNTTQPGGHIHWLDQNVANTFGGSEDPQFTLSELAPTGTVFRRYIQTVANAVDALNLTWSGTACIYPGDPGLIAYKLTFVNNSGSTVTLNATDSLEIALIGSLQQVDSTWAVANGGYGNVGGTDNTPWPAALTNAEPDYVYIKPAAGTTNLGQATVKKTSLSGLGWTSLQVVYLQNASRLKFKVQGSFGSLANGATQTVYFLQVLRRNMTVADVQAIAADYLAPGTPTMSVGTFTTFSYDERTYTFGSGTGNTLKTTLDLSPAHVTARYKPVVKVTGWTDTNAPLVRWAGSALTAGVDYRWLIDSTNHVLYLQLYYDIVPSGAVAGQKNNGLLEVQGARGLAAILRTQYQIRTGAGFVTRAQFQTRTNLKSVARGKFFTRTRLGEQMRSRFSTRFSLAVGTRSRFFTRFSLQAQDRAKYLTRPAMGALSRAKFLIQSFIWNPKSEIDVWFTEQAPLTATFNEHQMAVTFLTVSRMTATFKEQ